jgi:AAA15 family ATPase/GTPase
MWVKEIEVSGFMGRSAPLLVAFNRDLNIVTGLNGAGKTSFLKLTWCLMSGNIVEALREVPFDRARLVTSNYELTVSRTGAMTCRVDVFTDNRAYAFEDEEDEDGNVFRNAEDMASEIVTSIGSSIFFPTFRRIEGGFTLKSAAQTSSLFSARRASKPGPIEEGMQTLSAKLTNDQHRFVSSIATADIVTNLQKAYAERTETHNSQQSEMSKSIVDRIRAFEVSSDDAQSAGAAASILSSIRSEIESVEAGLSALMLPFSEIQDVVQKLFNHKGIKVGRVSFGDAAEAINSELMSAGEKQMLSFIAYNGLSADAVVFIDEPELSLHVDWQRSLFATLSRQRASNQFIIATHSPFIYGKYPDKEIAIAVDRGDSGVDDD